MRWQAVATSIGSLRDQGPFVVGGGRFDGSWPRAQAGCDIEVAQRELAPDLIKIKPWAGPAK